MGRDRDARGRKGKGEGRDAGGFVALPWSVLDSKGYLGLSHAAKALLLEVARQFHRDDNGRMLLSDKYLAGRGWTGHGVITRAKRELLDAGLIFQTVLGQRPNKAGWYALTWHKLDKLPGFDIGAALSFEQGAYRKLEAVVTLAPRVESKAAIATLAARVSGLQNVTLAERVEGPAIALVEGVEKAPPTPSTRAIRPVFDPPPTLVEGDPLEKPSTRAESVPAPQKKKGRVRSETDECPNDSGPAGSNSRGHTSGAAVDSFFGWTATGRTQPFTRKDGAVTTLEVLARPCRTCGKPFEVLAPKGERANVGTLCFRNCPAHRMTHAEVSRMGNLVANRNRKGKPRRPRPGERAWRAVS